MVAWEYFDPVDFEYDHPADKLALHGITFDEAVQCIENREQVQRSKHGKNRYEFRGRTIGRRRLLIVAQLKPGNILRIITGWHI